MRFLDTQIVSYAFKGIGSVSVDDEHISSVVANELLEAYSKAVTSANYYIPTNWRHLEQSGYFGPQMSTLRREYQKRGFSKRFTDRLTLDFGQDYPSVVEYGSIAVSHVINARTLRLFKISIASLDKRKQRRLIRRFEFLSDHRVKCVPLQPGAARLGQSILYRFCRKYKLKRNFRNSINDILILAAAIHGNGELLTRDSVLVKFCDDSGFLKKHRHHEWTRCEVTMTSTEQRSARRESKGYINRSWFVRQRRGISAGTE